MKTLHLATITILALVISIASNVYAQSSSTISASLAKVDVGFFNLTETSPTIAISGIVYKAFSQNIVLTIFNPQNQLISVSQLQPRLDGTFSQSIIPSNPLWPKGNYTVRVTSGSQNLTESAFYFPGIGCCKRIITPGVQGQLSNSTNPLSPLQQFKSGIAAKDVKCKQGLQLIFKIEDNSPACVKQQTASKLVERGWGIPVPTVTEQSIPIPSSSIMVTNTNFTLNYNISGNNKLLDANMDSQSKSLILSLNTTNNGTLTISIPRTLLDSKENNQDTQFIVLVDGQEIKYTETTSVTARILTIPFELGAEKIEIIATQKI